GVSHFELMNSILRAPPRPLPAAVPTGLKTVVSRCLEKEPGRRYRRAGELRAALEAVDFSADSTRHDVAPTRSPQSSWLRPAVIALSLIVITAVGILAIRNYKSYYDTKSLNSMPSRILLGVLPPIDAGDPTQSAFDSGLVDTLNSRLGE